MARDRIGNVVRSLALIPPEQDDRLMTVQKVVNGLNSAWGDEFQSDLSRFVLGWKPATNEIPAQAKACGDGLDRLRHRALGEELSETLPHGVGGTLAGAHPREA